MFNDSDNGQMQYCQFQNECIEYKDISYLKDMPICAIYDMSMVCHNKNKCKFFTVYNQIQQLKQENEKLKEEISHLNCTIEDLCEKTQKKLDKAEKMIQNYIYYNCDHYEDDNDCVNCNIVCWARDMEEVLFDRKIRGNNKQC